MAKVRVRIAPSPTGMLHVGTARAALFNELFARQNDGQFIVRIEDTDRERSLGKFEEDILAGLKWLGLKWDEGPDIGGNYGPYRQSERGDGYEKAIKQLLDSDKAYRVDGGQAIKLRVDDEEIVFADLIRGQVKVSPESWGGDFIIARSVSDAVYHLAVVVDDAAQAITHVIRGEDHLSNTGRHILLQRALGLETPIYAHLPLLLDEQRKKLSKRTNEVGLLAFRDMGFLPEAMLNYLALLGWNGGDEREYFSHDQLVKEFSLERVQKGGAIFSVQKLKSINQHYLRQLTPKELLAAATPWLRAADFDLADKAFWTMAVRLEQERVATLAEMPEALAFCRREQEMNYEAALLVWRKSDAQGAKKALQIVADKMDKIQEIDFMEGKLQADLLTWIDKEQLDRGEVLWPLRVALTGQEHSPGPFAVAATLGKIEVMKRLKAALSKIEKL